MVLALGVTTSIAVSPPYSPNRGNAVARNSRSLAPFNRISEKDSAARHPANDASRVFEPINLQTIEDASDVFRNKYHVQTFKEIGV
jgi:hypothetical protein